MFKIVWGKTFAHSSKQHAGMVRAVEADEGAFLRCVVLALLMTLSTMVMAADAGQDGRISFDIPQQRADLALTQFADQADLTLIFPFDEVRQRTGNRLVGDYRKEEAIEILLAGTGLTPTFSNRVVLSIAIDHQSVPVGKEMNVKKKAGLGAFLVAIFSVGAGAQEEAEDTADSVLDNILVTASKRGEVALQDTPMSIQAFTGEDLERRGVVEFLDYARSVSGLSFEDQGPGDKKYVLRGIQSTGAATTAVYFDDIVATGSNRQDGGGRQPDFRLVDMERIEILKGPQGTLYGASSMSGTIRMITSKPDATKFAGAVNAGVGSTRNANGENYDLDGMLNIPLVEDKLAVRLVGYYGEEAGYIDDMLDYGIGGLGAEGANNVTVTGGRAALRWYVTDDVTLDAMWVHQEIETDGAAWYQPLYGQFIQRNYHRLIWDESLDAYNLALEWVTDHGTFTATGSYMDRHMKYTWPATRTLCGLFTGRDPGCFTLGPDQVALQWNSILNMPHDLSNLSSELRYASSWNSRFQLIAGVFYQDEEDTLNSTLGLTDADGIPLDWSDPMNLVVHLRIDGTVEQRTAFGELSYDFTDKFTATVGARAFHFEIDELMNQFPTMFQPTGQSTTPSSTSEDDVTLKFNLSYDFTDDLMLYAGYVEGFRNGGNNGADFLTGLPLPTFQSDSVDSYEIGIKGAFFDSRLQLDAAAYYMDWSDIQQRMLAEDIEGTFLIMGNIGSASVKGLEIGAFLTPSQAANFTLGGNLTLLEAVLEEDAPVVGPYPGLKGDRIPDVPEFTGNLYADYSFPVLAGTWEAFARLDYYYVGDSFRTFRPDDPSYNKQGDYSLVNLRVSFDDGDRYRIGIFVNNVFDESAVVTHFVDPGLRRPDQITPLQPRTFGVSFGYQF